MSRTASADVKEVTSGHHRGKNRRFSKDIPEVLRLGRQSVSRGKSGRVSLHVIVLITAPQVDSVSGKFHIHKPLRRVI